MSPRNFIYQNIRERIRTGSLRPGMRLPTHRELSLDYGVAIATVTRAVNRLKMEGLLECRRGRGTVVMQPKPPEVKADNRRVMLIYPGDINQTIPFTSAINEVFINTQWKVETCCACDNINRFSSFLKDCRNNPPAGLLLVPLSKKFFSFTPDLLPAPGTKTVIWGVPIPGIEADCISAAAFGEGVVLGEYIASHQFRRVLYISQCSILCQEEEETLLGLSQVLNRKGIPFDDSHVLHYPDHYSYGSMRDPQRGAFEFIHNIINNNDLPDLIVTGHIFIANGIARALNYAGIKIPEQISLISADSNISENLFGNNRLQITSFENQYYMRSRIAAELLLSRLNGNHSPVTHCELLGHLVEGNSVRKISHLVQYKEDYP